MTAFINVAIVTALCLLVPVLRTYGVIGIGILLYFKPALTLGVLLIAGILYLFLWRKIA